MRCAALTLLALSMPVAGLSACAEPIEADVPIGSNAAFFTTSPEYFARPLADVTESTYLASAPFYSTNIAYFSAPTRVARYGYCPARGNGHIHGGGHHH